MEKKQTTFTSRRYTRCSSSRGYCAYAHTLIFVHPPPSDRLQYQHDQHQLLLYIEEALPLPASSAAIYAAASYLLPLSLSPKP